MLTAGGREPRPLGGASAPGLPGAAQTSGENGPSVGVEGCEVMGEEEEEELLGG